MVRCMIGAVTESGFGVYLHFPFCLRRCRYCDFFSTEGKTSLIEPYLRALRKEIAMVGQAGRKPPVDSVYFGGGTPSLLSPSRMDALLIALRQAFVLDPQAEVTLEANPRTVDVAKLSAYRAAGINRLSLGLQSGADDELLMLGRIHRAADSEKACADARRAGFENINLDFIFGLPGQTPAAWEQSLTFALSLVPDHISIYALTLERGTELARHVRCGVLPTPDEDTAAEMYEQASARLAGAGYQQYEISNWARPGDKPSGDIFPRFACRHNLRYWQNQPYVGLGAGAHGCAKGRRYANIRSVEKYIQRMESARSRRFPLTAATVTSRLRSREEDMRETMWLGLRLTQAGVSRRDFQSRFGEDFQDVFRPAVEESIAEGLLEWDGEDRLKLTARGRLLGNRVFSRFV
jgi:oxygen-independent coproporphyrinogen-3 oxidase